MDKTPKPRSMISLVAFYRKHLSHSTMAKDVNLVVLGNLLDQEPVHEVVEGDNAKMTGHGVISVVGESVQERLKLLAPLCAALRKLRETIVALGTSGTLLDVDRIFLAFARRFNFVKIADFHYLNVETSLSLQSF